MLTNVARRLPWLVLLIVFLGLVIWDQKRSMDAGVFDVLVKALGEHTEYAAGYSDQAFRTTRSGMTEQQVRAILGPPLTVSWSYDPENRNNKCVWISFQNDKVVASHYQECDAIGIRNGMSITEASAQVNPPDEIFWSYSKSHAGTHFRVRMLKFSHGRVSSVTTGWYLD